MFAGQRKEPFAVNLGEVFDLINLNPLGNPDAERSDTADKNITSLILEVPIECLTGGSSSSGIIETTAISESLSTSSPNSPSGMET